MQIDAPEPEPRMVDGRKTKPARPSTDDREMKKVDHKVVDEIIEYRGVLKNKTSFADSLIEKADPNTHRVHPTVRVTRVETGRISMSDPKRSWPSRFELPRAGVFARDSWHRKVRIFLLLVDYSQIEMRVISPLY